VSCGVGDDNVARSDAEGTQETDFQAWMARCMTALGSLAAKSQADADAAAAASSSSSSGCCTNCTCQSSSSSSSPLSAEHEAEIMEDLAAEDDEEESPSGPLAKGVGEPLVDVEDMGNMMKGARKTRRPPRTKAERRAAALAAAAAAAASGSVDAAAAAAEAADAAEVIDDENEDEEALVAAIKSGSMTAREMVTPEIRKSLTKQGYRVIGSHSGVKLCRWTKAMLRYALSEIQIFGVTFLTSLWCASCFHRSVVVVAATSTRATASPRTRAWR
jgi:tRNA wybutosine-synthesizing protein 1